MKLSDLYGSIQQCMMSRFSISFDVFQQAVNASDDGLNELPVFAGEESALRRGEGNRVTIQVHSSHGADDESNRGGPQ